MCQESTFPFSFPGVKKNVFNPMLISYNLYEETDNNNKNSAHSCTVIIISITDHVLCFPECPLKRTGINFSNQVTVQQYQYPHNREFKCLTSAITAKLKQCMKSNLNENCLRVMSCLRWVLMLKASLFKESHSFLIVNDPLIWHSVPFSKLHFEGSKKDSLQLVLFLPSFSPSLYA